MTVLSFKAIAGQTSVLILNQFTTTKHTMSIRPLHSIHTIIIHCTATPEDREVTLEEINTWHKARGFDMVGYHYFIDLKGHVHVGRELITVGAHASSYNKRSIGICYAGGCDKDMNPKDTLTQDQYTAMSGLVLALGTVLQKPLKIIGHNEISTKACPSFNVQDKFLGEQLLLERQSF